MTQQAVVRTSTGTKTHVAYVYEDGSTGRYALCGADTRFITRLPEGTEATCKKCAKAAPAKTAMWGAIEKES